MTDTYASIAPWGKLAVMATMGAVLSLASLSSYGAELFTNPVLPKEADTFQLVYRTDKTSEARSAAFKVFRADGSVLTERIVPLEEEADALQAALELTVPHNGLLRAEVVAGGPELELVIPVISAKREVHLIYYGMSKEALQQGYLRWVTVVTSCGTEIVEDLNRRGIKPLRWHWGSNYLGEKQKELGESGIDMTPELAREVGRHLYVSQAAEAVQEGYAGFGMDEFGGYAASDFAENTKGFVRGIIDARHELPEDFVMAAWHGGPIDSELMGLYKQAVEFLLPEAYLLEIVPAQLGTELIHKDLGGRLVDARFNDMLTAPYGSRCRVIPCVDVTDSIPVGEYENFYRMLRREFPEVRGIGFFNVLSKEREKDYRIINELCFDYFIRPVLTFQPDSLYFDRFGSGRVTAYLSNIGAMDSGPVTMRLLVDDQEAARAHVSAIPAGFSRVDNRAAALFDWQPEESGTYRLRAELVDAGEATVLDPAIETTVFLRR